MTIQRRQMAEGLTDDFLAGRFASAGKLPGLREATIELAADAFAHGNFERLIREQLDQLRNPSSTAVPDAYMADEAAIEDALQHAAAGIRTAMAQNGQLLDPVPFERGAAARLADDPRLALRAELSRVPRPTTRPGALRWSLEPAPWASEHREQGSWPPDGLEVAASQRCLPGGHAAFARVDSGSHTNWIQISMIEQHTTPARRYPEAPERQTFVALGIEISDHCPPPSTVPFGSTNWKLWTTTWRPPGMSAAQNASQLATVNSPLVAFADDGHGGHRLRRTGPGSPPLILVPVAPLIAVFDLVPTQGVCGFSLSDTDGPAIISRHWRGHPVHDGSYHPLFPAVEGADLLLRPDLFNRLTLLAGEHRVHAGVTAYYEPDEDDEGTEDLP